MSSSPLAEEKEKNTLRVLMTSSVSGLDYLIGTIIPPLVILTITNLLLIPASGIAYADVPLLSYLVMTTVASFISLLIGYVVGIFSQNQTQSALISMPVTLLFTSVPVIRFLQNDLSYLVDYTYTGVLTNFASTLFAEGQYNWNLFDTSVLGAYLLLSAAIFVLAYKRNGLDR
ncbi:membrane spanning protein [Bacillus sp. JCM 19047]|nr:membrane spanning protein [Bacillus sp. JCM 19047]